jgi:hypothetical protein
VTCVSDDTSFDEVRYDVTSAGEWFHAVYVKDSSDIELFIDGVSQGTTTYTSFDSPDNNTFHIGNGGARYFDGMIDDVRVYSRALSANEVSQLYNKRT